MLCLAASLLSVIEQAAQRSFLRGNAAYGQDNLVEAQQAYLACLQADPAHTGCQTNLASVLVDLGDNELEAERLYRSVLAAEAANGDAAYNLGLILQDRKTDEATREAADLYQLAVDQDATRWDAWANLAAARSEFLEPLRAISAFQRAILLLEEMQTEAEAQQEQMDDAFDHYLARLYYGYGIALADLAPPLCVALAAQSDSLLLGAARQPSTADGAAAEESALKACSESAHNALRSALHLKPDYAEAEYMIHVKFGAGDSVDRASPAFVAALFDDFSDTFEAKLSSLSYKVPEIIGAAATAIASARGSPFASALDAGCGTGLAGPYLRPHVSGRLVGVDLSTKMLAHAASLRSPQGSPVYDDTLEVDLLEMTLAQLSPGEGRGFALLTAADVLVYFGDLGPLFASFALISAPDGSLLFTCERVSADEAPSGWRLNSSGRFAHTKEYVVSQAEAAGFSLASYEEIVPRMELNVPVQGHLFTFVRGAEPACADS